MTETIVKLELKYENGKKVSLEHKKDDDETYTIIEADEQGNLPLLIEGIKAVMFAHMVSELEVMVKVMKEK